MTWVKTLCQVNYGRYKKTVFYNPVYSSKIVTERREKTQWELPEAGAESGSLFCGCWVSVSQNDHLSVEGGRGQSRDNVSALHTTEIHS